MRRMQRDLKGVTLEDDFTRLTGCEFERPRQVAGECRGSRAVDRSQVHLQFDAPGDDIDETEGAPIASPGR